MIPAAAPDRWFDETSYANSWGTRNADMLALFDKTIANSNTMSFAEYGCGPHAPFSAEVAKSSSREVIRWDMKRWDENVRTIDFNKKISGLLSTDVGVLSGVLEYINDIDNTLDALSSVHKYLLISYANRQTTASFAEFAAMIDHRQSKNGWRSHLSTEEIVNILSRFGFIKAMSIWQNHQVLAIVELYEK